MAEPLRRFPPIVRDANGQATAYLYSRENEAEARQAKVVTRRWPPRHLADVLDRVDELHHLGTARPDTVALAKMPAPQSISSAGIRRNARRLPTGHTMPRPVTPPCGRRREPGRRGLLSGEGLPFAGALILVVGIGVAVRGFPPPAPPARREAGSSFPAPSTRSSVCGPSAGNSDVCQKRTWVKRRGLVVP
jgi:hypothetical protein